VGLYFGVFMKIGKEKNDAAPQYKSSKTSSHILRMILIGGELIFYSICCGCSNGYCSD
jgi:hypothetical protein